MTEKRYLPDPTRVSILTAAILLAFALTHILNVPHYSLTISLAGLYINVSFNLNTLIVLLAAGLTAAGVDWLLRTHPSLEKGEIREHWLLPTLTVLVLGVALYTLPPTLVWWLGFGLGAVLLVVVFFAEFVAVDAADSRYPFATAILTVLAFVIFLILAVALKASNARLYLVGPALFVGSGLVALRTLHLRLNERWELSWAIGIAVVIVQLGAALYYMPLTPVRFGLALLAPLYALTIFAVSLANGHPVRQAILEPTVMFILLCGLMIWFH
ncbi:MAG: hypothetical protein WCE68_10450 [Anaerolineales bacterium]